MQESWVFLFYCFYSILFYSILLLLASPSQRISLNFFVQKVPKVHIAKGAGDHKGERLCQLKHSKSPKRCIFVFVEEGYEIPLTVSDQKKRSAMQHRPYQLPIHHWISLRVLTWSRASVSQKTYANLCQIGNCIIFIAV